MDESAALSLISELLPAAGDDAAVIDDLVITTDMLHEQTDFPDGVTPYTMGWRSVGASLSDVAAMGADAVAAVAVYAAPQFQETSIRSFISGATDVCELVSAEYVGGDLDRHRELTVASTVVGRSESPVYRSGASAGERVYVTGTLGRSAAALDLFREGEVGLANSLFQFEPRVAFGKTIQPVASAMMDSSDGLARSLHQLATASDVGFDVAWEKIPVDPVLKSVSKDVREHALHFGEDFELVFTASPDEMRRLSSSLPDSFQEIGIVTESEVTIDGDSLADRGYTHGNE